jgi:hypothetical protein
VLVGIAGLGSVWRRRFGKDPSDPKRFVRAAYYNTTGVEVEGRIRQRPRIIGYARFNGVGGFDANHPSRNLNRVFESDGPRVWRGQNRLFFRRVLMERQEPDAFLVVVQNTLVGHLEIAREGWKSGDTWLLSFSEDGERQEAMLLMRPGSWLRSRLGFFRLEACAQAPWQAELRLHDLSDRVGDCHALP